MTESLIADCGQLLRDVATVTVSAAQVSPQPDSPMAAELSRDTDLADDDLQAPFGFAHTIHRSLVYFAGERLITLAWCVEAVPQPHVISASELARAAAEAAATGIWLGDAEADGERRLRRMLGLLAQSANEELGLRRALRLGDSNNGTQRALQWANTRGLTHERPPTRAARLLRARPDAADPDYRRLSALAHSTVYAVIGTWIEVVAAQSGNIGPIRIHSVMSAAAALRYCLAGTHSMLRTANVSLDKVPAMVDRLDDLEAEALAMAQELGWDLP